MRLPIRYKLVLLLTLFLILMAGLFLKLSYDYFLQDKITSIREIQTLQSLQAGKEVAARIDGLRADMKEIAVRLLDPSRGAVDANAIDLEWVKVGDKTWTREPGVLLNPSLPTYQEKWLVSSIQFSKRDFVLISEKLVTQEKGINREVVVYSLIPKERFYLAKKLDRGPVKTLVLQESKNHENFESNVFLSSKEGLKLFKSFSDSFLLGDAKKNIYSVKQSSSQSYSDENGNIQYLFAASPISLGEAGQRWITTSLVSFESVMSSIQYFIFQMVFSLVLILGASLVGASLLARHLSKPIEKIVEATRLMETGKFETRVEVIQKDEIGDLARAFNHMGQSLADREKALNEAHGALVQSEKLATLGTLSAGIAHEVKNPLAGIMGNADLALMATQNLGEDLKVKINNYLDVIKKEAKRTRSIIDGLMRFSRKETTALVQIDLELVAWDAIQLMEHSLNMGGVKINKKFDPKLKTVLGNSNQVEQVLLNMMQNAGHAMVKGGVLDLETFLFTDAKSAPVGDLVAYKHPDFHGPFARVSVKDSGSGMTTEVMKKIFEPFFTTKEAGKGTGLGLAVTMNILAEHKARISITSHVGQGTTFFIDFMVSGDRTVEMVEKLSAFHERFKVSSHKPVVKKEAALPPVAQAEKIEIAKEPSLKVEGTLSGIRTPPPPTSKVTAKTDPSYRSNIMRSPSEKRGDEGSREDIVKPEGFSIRRPGAKK
ncbi:MAG: HAMP domain-containing protein [Proteobacteria bacterium]|nr:HAMP domain-containing protein [Pseudomonadota bacterium]